MKEFSLAGFIAHVAALPVAVHEAAHHGLDEAARVVQTEAKKEIGTYQGAAGPFAAWKELADSTKADRVTKGFPENDPLLRTGALRDSIERKVEMHGVQSGEAHIGSNLDIAVYQEMGTARIPPRSFLGGAAFRKSHEVRDIIGDNVVKGLSGQAVGSGRLLID